MAVQCLKSTKTNDKVLACLQALTLDTVGPLTHLLEKLNLEESEIDADEVGYAVESAIKQIGNASSQMSILRRQKILEEYNKDLLSFAQDREEEFTKAAPQLFGAQFPKEAADHLDQVEALRRAKSLAVRVFARLLPPDGQACDRTQQDKGQNPLPGQRRATASRRHRKPPNDNQCCT